MSLLKHKTNNLAGMKLRSCRRTVRQPSKQPNVVKVLDRSFSRRLPPAKVGTKNKRTIIQLDQRHHLRKNQIAFEHQLEETRQIMVGDPCWTPRRVRACFANEIGIAKRNCLQRVPRLRACFLNGYDRNAHPIPVELSGVACRGCLTKQAHVTQ